MIKNGIITIIVLLFLASCSKLTRALKIDDHEERYKAGVAFYEKEDYYRANVVFEDLIPILTGTNKAEKLQLQYAYSFFHQKLYSLSSHYFKSFYDVYGRSEFATEALFMYVKSLYQSTPDYNLDQSNTKKTVEAAQDFLNRYPKSKFSKELSGMIQTLRGKQELKAFSIAKHYHKLRRYKAAFIAYNNFQKDFPDSDYRDQATYFKIQTQYEIYKLSVESKKKERIEVVMNAYYYFIDKYPNSKHLKNAEDIYTACQRYLSKDLLSK